MQFMISKWGKYQVDLKAYLELCNILCCLDIYVTNSPPVLCEFLYHRNIVAIDFLYFSI